MKIRALISAIALVAGLGFGAVRADDKDTPKVIKKDDQKTAPKVEKKGTDSLAPFKELAGEWVGKGTGDKEMQNVHVLYKVTGGGSTVVETMSPGTDHEMITVIHRDGKDLVLTHYCSLGNQPHMKASKKSKPGQVAFRFASGSNMKSDKDMHMHAVTYTFVDKDTLKSSWTMYKDGKPGGKTVIELKRKS